MDKCALGNFISPSADDLDRTAIVWSRESDCAPWHDMTGRRQSLSLTGHRGPQLGKTPASGLKFCQNDLKEKQMHDLNSKLELGALGRLRLILLRQDFLDTSPDGSNLSASRSSQERVVSLRGRRI